jgi:hypothetical protein
MTLRALHEHTRNHPSPIKLHVEDTFVTGLRPVNPAGAGGRDRQRAQAAVPGSGPCESVITHTYRTDAQGPSVSGSVTRPHDWLAARYTDVRPDTVAHADPLWTQERSIRVVNATTYLHHSRPVGTRDSS